MANAQMFNEFHAVVDVGLDSIGHGHADDTVHTEGFGTKTCDDTTVLAARNADDGVAALSIHFKPVANPLDDLVFYLFCVKFHIQDSKFIIQDYIKLLPPINWRSIDVAGISLSETGVK